MPNSSDDDGARYGDPVSVKFPEFCQLSFQMKKFSTEANVTHKR